MPVTNSVVAAVEPHEALDRVGRDALVGVTDMRRAVGVGNGGGDVEALVHRPLS